MGPIALFDKSFLQSLSEDESVWFDHFFLALICPIFYVETLADLEKAVREGRTPEQEVGYIAAKTPQLSGNPCLHHEQLCVGDLLGHPVPMTGQIPIAGGRPVSVDGKKGVVYDVAPEREAFQRWQEGKFLEVERRFARVWRDSLVPVDQSFVKSVIGRVGADLKSIKSIEDAYKFASAWVNSAEHPFDRLRLLFLVVQIPNEYLPRIISHWERAGSPPLAKHAPYTAHVLTVELFLHLAIAANLISGERPSNRIDVAYLFYLPFCMIFISSDKLHRLCAEPFLATRQRFVWGIDLKSDLGKLNEHYLQMSEKEREAGLFKLAPHPPDGAFLTTKLWDEHMGKWRNRPKTPTMDPEKEKALVEYLQRFTKAPTSPDPLPARDERVEMLSLTRSIKRKKGSWWQVPKDLPDTNDK